MSNGHRKQSDTSMCMVRLAVIRVLNNHSYYPLKCHSNRWDKLTEKKGIKTHQNNI